MDLNSWNASPAFTVDLEKSIEGITWDGGSLRLIDEEGNIVQYDRTGQRLRQLAAGILVGNFESVVSVGDKLWAISIFGEMSQPETGGGFVQVGFFDLYDLDVGGFLYDVALDWDGENLWLAHSINNRIFRFALVE